MQWKKISHKGRMQGNHLHRVTSVFSDVARETVNDDLSSDKAFASKVPKEGIECQSSVSAVKTRAGAGSAKASIQ